MFHSDIYHNPSDPRTTYYLHQQNNSIQGGHAVTSSPQTNQYHRFVPQTIHHSRNNSPSRVYTPHQYGYRGISVRNTTSTEETIIASPLHPSSKQIFLLPDKSVYSSTPESDLLTGDMTFSISNERLLEIIESSMKSETLEGLQYVLKVVTGHLYQLKESKAEIRPLLIRLLNRLIEADKDIDAKLLLDHAVRIELISRSSEEYFRLNYLMVSKIDELNERTAYLIGNYLLNLTTCDMSMHEEWEELFPLTVDVIKQLLSLQNIKLIDQLGDAKLPRFILDELGQDEQYPWARPLILKLLIGLSNQQLDNPKEKILNQLLAQNPSCLQDLDKSIPEEKYLECIRSQPIQDRCLLLFRLLDKNLNDEHFEITYSTILEIFRLLQEDHSETLPDEFMDPIIKKHSVNLMGALQHFSESKDQVKALRITSRKVVNHILSNDNLSNSMINLIVAFDLTTLEVLQQLMEHGKQKIPIDIRESIWRIFAEFLKNN